jgi:K+-sensing histidine kinase KdpD
VRKRNKKKQGLIFKAESDGFDLIALSSKNGKSLAHDLRELNRGLKASIEKIQEVFRHNRNTLGREEVIATTAYFQSEMLSKRLDMYDYFENSGAIDTAEKKYVVYKVIEKVFKILGVKSEKRGIIPVYDPSQVEISSSGKFETVFFVIIENFIKYSPERESVYASVSKSEIGDVSIRFKGFGPQLETDEVGRVFDFEFRGTNAKKFDRSGTGMGLHYAKSMCDRHGFQIALTQDRSNSLSRDGTDYSHTCVEILVPIGAQ